MQSTNNTTTGERHEVVDPAVRGIEFLLKIRSHGMHSNWQNLASPQRPSVLQSMAAGACDTRPRVQRLADEPTPTAVAASLHGRGKALRTGA